MTLSSRARQPKRRRCGSCGGDRLRAPGCLRRAALAGVVPREALEETFRDFLSIPGLSRYLVRRRRRRCRRRRPAPVGRCGAALWCRHLPNHRRQGVQSSALRARLLDAAENGADVAVVTTQPGSKWQENVQRAGFVLLYARAILVRAARDGAPLLTRDAQ